MIPVNIMGVKKLQCFIIAKVHAVLICFVKDGNSFSLAGVLIYLQNPFYIFYVCHDASYICILYGPKSIN